MQEARGGVIDTRTICGVPRCWLGCMLGNWYEEMMRWMMMGVIKTAEPMDDMSSTTLTQAPTDV
jgi:hypothetical protein